MFRLVCLLAGSLLLANIYSAAEVECQPQDHKPPHPSGALLISDFAVQYSLEPCPKTRLTTDERIEVKSGGIYIWLRLQGDEDYLTSKQARIPIDVDFYMVVGPSVVLQKSISMGNIEIDEAEREAEGFGGIFDWRTYVRKIYFIQPGSYLIRVRQGISSVCGYKNLLTDCQIPLLVE